MKIFLAGSISTRELPKEVRARLLDLSVLGHEFIVGDAHGADLAFQKALSQNQATLVSVYYSGPQPRNNVARWPSRRENSAQAKSGYRMHGQKDAAMAKLADMGLMIWDGKSKGTLANCINLVREGKPCELWILPEQRFSCLKSEQDLETLSGISPESDEALLQAYKRTKGHRGQNNDLTLF